VSDAYIRENLRLAHDAGMNMVRVWGGGVYESALFYDECDRLGLLVWQDFLFACGSYPEDPVFRRNVAAEAREAIRALRNHPSLALWCGNNECQWLFPPKKGHQGTRYYEDILPALCAELDPDRPYWPGSPFGPTRDDANAPTHGDHHAWEVWGQNADHLASYYFDCGRFISEFGFQAPPTRPTLDSCLAPEDRTPWSAAFEAHEKMPDGLARPYKYLAQHFPVPADLDAWVYVSQALQCLALRTGIGHWRARKWATAGTLFWQLNDCWPALSWSVVDYQCRPKPSWYEVRRLYAPRFLTLQPVIPPDVHGAWELLRFGRLHTLDLTVHLVNDTLADAPAHVRARLLSLTGEVVWSEERTVVVPTNGALEAMDIPRAGLGDFDPTCHVLVADWSTHPEGEGVVSRDLYTFVEPKHLALTPDALEVTRDGENVTITARALALYVAIDAGSAIPSDAFFHLLPGETRTVALHGEVGDVRVRSLGDVSAR
jgi:beta-mannosidase